MCFSFSCSLFLFIYLFDITNLVTLAIFFLENISENVVFIDNNNNNEEAREKN